MIPRDKKKRMMEFTQRRKEASKMQAQKEAIVSMFYHHFNEQDLETQTRFILNLAVDSFKKHVVGEKASKIDKVCVIVGTAKQLLEQIKEL